jgi:hypothetical protein
MILTPGTRLEIIAWSKPYGRTLSDLVMAPTGRVCTWACSIYLRQPRNGTARVRRFSRRLQIGYITPWETVSGSKLKFATERVILVYNVFGEAVFGEAVFASQRTRQGLPEP